MSYSNEFNNLIKKVNEYSLDDVEKNSQLYFVKKIFTKDKDNNKKRSWLAMNVVATNIIRKIHKIVDTAVQDSVIYKSNGEDVKKSVKKYTPTSNNNNEEILVTDYNYLNDQPEEFIKKLLHKESEKMLTEEMQFFTYSLNIDNQTAYFIGKVEKLNAIKNGLIAKFTEDGLKLGKNDQFGIKDHVGVILYDKNIYILKKYIFEVLFDLEEKFLKETKKNINNISNSKHFIGLDVYLESIKNNRNITRKISKAVEKFNENGIDYSNINSDNFKSKIDIINQHGEDFKLNKNNQLEIEKDTDIDSITRLITDDYYFTVLTDSFGYNE